MEYLSLFGLIFIIHLLAVISPGPDFVMVLKNALQFDRKTAVYTALGISMGIAVHILYSVAGVALLLKNNTSLFNIVKTAGALYIMYIGIKTLKPSPEQLDYDSLNSSAMPEKFQAIKTGFITNVTNPKASLFFLSVFSLLIPPGTPSGIILLLALMLIFVTFLWFVIVAYVFTNPVVVKAYEKYENTVLKLLGLILLILGSTILIEMFNT